VAFQPWYVHQTFPAISIPLDVEGNPDNITSLTTASFTMVIRNLATNIDTTGTGTFGITTSNPAVITYQFSDADTQIATNVNLFIKANFPAASPSLAGVAIYDPIAFTFTAD
jgi:hypothetical protein